MRRAADNPRPVATVLAAAGVVLVLAGCGEGDTEPGVSPPATTQTQNETGTATAPGEDATTTTGEQMPIDPGDPSGAEPTGQVPELGPGDVLTQDVLGATVRLPVGDEVTVQLAPPLQDATPRVDDPAVVELVPVEYFADPGYAEYTLIARGLGETTVSLVGPDGTEDLLAQVIVEDD